MNEPVQPWPQPPQQPPWQQPYPQGPYAFAPPQPPTDGFAIASLVLGIVWVWGIGSILAVIFGHVALGHMKRENRGGRGLAIAGLVLGYIGVAVIALIFVFFIAIAASAPASGS